MSSICNKCKSDATRADMELRSKGHRIHRFVRCDVCGNEWEEVLRWHPMEDNDAIADMPCPNCGEYVPDDADPYIKYHPGLREAIVIFTCKECGAQWPEVFEGERVVMASEAIERIRADFVDALDTLGEACSDLDEVMDADDLREGWNVN